ncbi:ras-related protein rab-24 [Anaeramoeba flamelloides]|uniref:Ras-related protein rab-24 n=1 Tax=Anaeramoeba flamelloides TaxID=1746091 RepID=A0ABQ8XRU4_9EUKA|nr:ras-related protein rab-24 [Anaeramoeba flamelloides]
MITKSKKTIGVSFGLKTIKIDQSEIVLGLWDTAGQERFESLSKLYFRKASAAILCFNPSNRQSFHKAKFWYKELNKNETNCVVYLVATKIDLISSQENWVIQKEQVDNFIKKFKIKSFETSAKENIGINDLFTAIGQDYLNRSEDVDDDDEEELVSLDLRKKNSNNTCC